MTITFPLEPQEEARLNALAESKGVSTGAVLTEAVQRYLDDADVQVGRGKTTSSLLDIFLEGIEEVPAEEWEKLPRDGASEVDHYLYGSPKKYS
jgi:hypothetical protein